MGLLSMLSDELLGMALDELRRPMEKELVDRFIADHKHVMLEAYREAVRDGHDGDTAMLMAVRRGLRHAL